MRTYAIPEEINFCDRAGEPLYCTYPIKPNARSALSGLATHFLLGLDDWRGVLGFCVDLPQSQLQSNGITQTDVGNGSSSPECTIPLHAIGSHATIEALSLCIK